MAGLVEGFSATLNWPVRATNVIVEGTSDVALMWCAARLYYERHNTAILGDQIAILPAGIGNDGGVDGVNRRLHTARQIADADRDHEGALRYRFIGLYDNDNAGRRGVEIACSFDRRLLRYADLFLLHPIMPLAAGVDHTTLRRRFEAENAPFKGLDWEVEDLLSERLLTAFEKSYPRAICEIRECGGRKHREYTREGKEHLHRYVPENARLEDVVEVIKLVRALRDYLRVKSDHILC